ncbi:MAG: DUF4153 domain-containing protein [Planctomycetota bacterium]|nr:DUF4153 domain-containing protein [Planctomycetota bacterium]
MSSPTRVVANDDSHSLAAGSFATTATISIPISVRQLIGVICCVAACDVTIYRGEGFGGLALLFLFAPLLLWLSSQRLHRPRGLVLMGMMCVPVAVKTAWSGSDGLATIGFALIIPYGMMLAGWQTNIRNIARFVGRVPLGGWQGLLQCGRQFRFSLLLPRATWIKVLLPLVAVIVFGGVFVQANPRMLTWLAAAIALVVETMWNQVELVSPVLLEVGFCLVVAMVVLGLVRPSIVRRRNKPVPERAVEIADPTDTVSWHVYASARNTLVTVIVLFSGYLLYEFMTLWNREFEKGFHYSGYAHKGAAWLTVALALATLVLGVVFRGRMLMDRRVRSLKRLAWAWSLLNLLLAVAVYNRLLIYIDFNGLTRMRIVGLFGISTVVVGFVLVVWKIARGCSFGWLIHRQLVALAIAIFLFSITPVDEIWVRFNVGRILAGETAPAVQLSAHRIGPGGLLQLAPALECDDEIIREGVRALFAEHHRRITAVENKRRELGWTSWQLADRMALRLLDENRASWSRYEDVQARELTRRRFDEYTYLWY